MKKNKLSVVSLRMKLNSMRYSKTQLEKLTWMHNFEYDRAVGWNNCIDEMLLYLKNVKDDI